MLVDLIQTYQFILVPFFAWVVGGVLKFAVNTIRFKKLAWDLIGTGGFPSNHTVVISSIVFLIGFQEGFYSSIFGLGLAIMMIVITDAINVRRIVGYHSEVLNKLVLDKKTKPFRTRVGHSKLEVIGGLVVGFSVAFAFSQWFNMINY